MQRQQPTVRVSSEKTGENAVFDLIFSSSRQKPSRPDFSPVESAETQAEDTTEFPPPQDKKSFVSALRQLRRRALKQPVDLPIEIADGLHGPCWESELTDKIRRGAADEPQRLAHKNGKTPFLFRRITQQTRSAPPPLTETGPAVVAAWNVAPEVETYALGLWQKPLRMAPGRFKWSFWSRRFFQLELSPPPQTQPQDEDSGSATRFLHLIGNVEAAESGLALRLAAGESGVSAATARATDSLLLATDIARRAPQLCACLIQQEPLWEGLATERAESERRRGERARSFAAELYALGVPVVIVVPALSPTAAALTLQPILRALLLRHQNGLPALHEAIARARETIAATAAPAPRIHLSDLPGIKRDERFDQNWPLLTRALTSAARKVLESGAVESRFSGPDLERSARQDQGISAADRLNGLVEHDAPLVSLWRAPGRRWLSVGEVLGYLLHRFQVRVAIWRGNTTRRQGGQELLQRLNRRLLERLLVGELRPLDEAKAAQTARDLAFEVCFYAPPQWNGRVGRRAARGASNGSAQRSPAATESVPVGPAP